MELDDLLGGLVERVESCARAAEVMADASRLALGMYNGLVLELRAQVRLMRNCVNCGWSVASVPSPGASCPEHACLCPYDCDDLSCWIERCCGGIDG